MGHRTWPAHDMAAFDQTIASLTRYNFVTLTDSDAGDASHSTGMPTTIDVMDPPLPDTVGVVFRHFSIDGAIGIAQLESAFGALRVQGPAAAPVLASYFHENDVTAPISLYAFRSLVEAISAKQQLDEISTSIAASTSEEPSPARPMVIRGPSERSFDRAVPQQAHHQPRAPPPPDPLEEIGNAFEGIGRAFGGAMDALGSAFNGGAPPQQQPARRRYL